MSNVKQPPLPAEPAPAQPDPKPPVVRLLADPGPPPVARLLLLGTRVFRLAVVLLLVAFHVAVLAIRNPLDLWEKEIRADLSERPIDGKPHGSAVAADLFVGDPPPSYLDDKDFKERFERADENSKRFVRSVGFEQDWCMFGPPLAQSVDFLAVRLDFEDESSELIRSPNEPADPTRYLRVGGWQIRKMENYLIRPSRSDLRDPSQRQFWEGYARLVLRNWKQDHPNDPRKLQSIVFVRHRLFFPKQGQLPQAVDEPTVADVAIFDAQGRNGSLP